jgi:hypothetical protein
MRRARAFCTLRQVSDLRLEPGGRLLCDVPPRLFPVREAEAQELAFR